MADQVSLDNLFLVHPKFITKQSTIIYAPVIPPQIISRLDLAKELNPLAALGRLCISSRERAKLQPCS